MKIMLSFALLVAVVSGGFLFHIKHEVIALENSVKQLTHRLSETKERLGILKAEWSYLTHPERINKLVSRHLPGAGPFKKEQLLVMPALQKGTPVVRRTKSAL